jgi:phosphate transport system substrate-binding protein
MAHKKGTRVSLRHRTVVGLLAALPTLALPASASALKLIGSGSSAEQPILNVLFRGYSQVHRNTHFSYNPNGGNAGVADVQAGRSEFAVNTRPQLPSDVHTTYIKLFLDGLCLAVNPANSLSNLSITDTKNIFTGLTTSWSQVSGSNLGSNTVDPVGRNTAAGSYTFFKQAVLGTATQSSNVIPETSDGLVQTQVQRDHNAIGYVGLSHSGTGSGVKRLTLNGIACNDQNIQNNTYPLWRFIWAVIPTPGSGRNTDPNVLKFIQWVRTSHKAGQIIKRAGAVTAFNK